MYRRRRGEVLLRRSYGRVCLNHEYGSASQQFPIYIWYHGAAAVVLLVTSQLALRLFSIVQFGEELVPNDEFQQCDWRTISFRC